VNKGNVWLNRQQMADLFDRDVKTIGKHINNALKEELDNSVVANFATTASDGKSYQEKESANSAYKQSEMFLRRIGRPVLFFSHPRRLRRFKCS